MEKIVEKRFVVFFVSLLQKLPKYVIIEDEITVRRETAGGVTSMKERKEELTLSEQEHRNGLQVLFNGVFVCTVFVWVLRFAFSGLLKLLAPKVDSYYLLTALSLLGDGLSVLLPFLLFHKVRRDPFRPIFLEKPRSEHPFLRCVIGVVSVFCLAVCAMMLVDFGLGLLESNGVHSAITRPDFGQGKAQALYYVILSTLIYSFCYETAFRGIAVRAMKEENQTAAVLVSGLAFAFSDGEPHHVAVRLAVGFLLGWFYLRVRSVWACMALHAAAQAAICFAFRFSFDPLFESYLFFICLVLGVSAAFFLFFPKKEKEPSVTSKGVSLRIVFTTFGVWVLAGLLAFNMMSFTFYMEDAPDLITPEHGQRDPLFNNPTDRAENIPNYQENMPD